MSEAQNVRGDLLYAGLAVDIYTAERARALHAAVGRYASEINTGGYGELFSTIQNAAISEFTLSLAKLFERSSKRYAVRSIPAMLQLLRKNADTIDTVQPNTALRDFVLIRSRRDKVIAHNEVVDAKLLPRTRWQDAEALLNFAKNVMAGVGMAFFASAWADDSGHFGTSDDAESAAIELRELLRQSGIVPSAR